MIGRDSFTMDRATRTRGTMAFQHRNYRIFFGGQDFTGLRSGRRLLGRRFLGLRGRRLLGFRLGFRLRWGRRSGRYDDLFLRLHDLFLLWSRWLLLELQEVDLLRCVLDSPGE